MLEVGSEFTAADDESTLKWNPGNSSGVRRERACISLNCGALPVGDLAAAQAGLVSAISTNHTASRMGRRHPLTVGLYNSLGKRVTC